jgi:hypothetical protein
MLALLILAIAGQLALAAPEPVCGLPPPSLSAALSSDQSKNSAHPKRGRTRRRSSHAALNAKCLRLELLQRREALLHDFLIRTQTETPQFEDRRTYRLDIGAKVGPVVVTRDFVGSPIIRVQVTNVTSADLSFLLSARLASKNGASSGASTVILLRAHETRTVELLCPDTIVPQSLTWSTMPL